MICHYEATRAPPTIPSEASVRVCPPRPANRKERVVSVNSAEVHRPADKKVDPSDKDKDKESKRKAAPTFVFLWICKLWSKCLALEIVSTSGCCCEVQA